jgi:SAM-dependent methyltransferase
MNLDMTHNLKQSVSLFSDPDLYDAHYFTLTKDVRFYQKLAVKSGGPVLELGVGTGRIASAILEKGVSVVGLDLSFEMIKKALTAQRPPKKREALLFQSDFCQFSLRKKFPLIFAGFNSLQFMCDPARLPSLFNCVKEHLSSDGIFAFDILNDETELKFPPGAPYLRERFFDERINCVCQMWETYELNVTTKVKKCHWRYSWANGDETEKEICFQMYSSKEMLQAIQNNGFKVMNHYGDFDGGSFSPISPKQIFVLRLV